MIKEMIFDFLWTIFHFISGSVLGIASTRNEIGTFVWAISAVRYGNCEVNVLV